MATPSSEKAKSTIVIKRIKKSGHAAHGAAWKIAYADFVTAMMAFFLLMWLLGSTTKGDLKGIAQYFQSPLQVAMSGGSGSGDATSIIPGGGEDLTRVVGQRKQGEREDRRKSGDRKQQQERRRAEQLARMEELKARIDGAILANATLSEFRNQIRVEITPDGLRIQIVDDFRRPMFDLGGATVMARFNAIARACREGRIVTSMTLDEVIHPLRDADGAATLERLVQGGRTTILPISVSGDVVGALVVGPMADEPGFSTVVKVRDIVNETASRLAEVWRTGR